MRSKLIAFLVSVVMIVSLPRLAFCEAPSMAKVLPADSLGYVELPDMEVFYYLISELGAAAVESLNEEAEVPADVRIKASAILGAFNEIKPLLPRSASLGIISIDPQRGQPSLVVVAELSEPVARLASAASKLLALAPHAKVRKTDHGIEVAFPEGPVPTVGIAVIDNVLYAVTGEGLLDRLLSRARSDLLSDTPHFQAVDAITGKNAFVSAYVNVDAIREKILPFAPPQMQQMTDLLGLKDIHAAGLSLSADEELVGFNLALQYTEDAPGIPSLLSIPNTTPKGIAYVPEDFSYVARVSPGPPDELLKKVCAFLERLGKGQEVAAGLAGLKEGKGIDVEKILASVGGEITVAVKFPEALQAETDWDVVACLEVRDPEYLMGLLKDLLSGEEAPASLTETEVAGRKSWLLTFKAEVPIQPVLVVDGDVMVVGISQGVVEKALAAKESGQNIGSKPAFKAAMEGLPTRSNVAMAYVELEPLRKMVVAGLTAAAMYAPEPAGPMITKILPYVKEAVQNLENGAVVIYRTPNGLVIQSRLGTRSVMQILRAGAALGIKAVVLKMKAPAEVPVEEARKQDTIPEANLRIPDPLQACAANFEKIRAALEEYKKDKDSLPDWLSDLVPDYLDAQALLCGDDPDQKDQYWPDPKLPCSYTYEFSAAKVPDGWGRVSGMVCRDWKAQQVKLFGNVVPVVRCHRHANVAVNLSVGGQIYWSPSSWEFLFIPNYNFGDEFSEPR